MKIHWLEIIVIALIVVLSMGMIAIASAQDMLSEHFSKAEFNQKQEPLPLDSLKIDPMLIEKLEALRSLVGAPIIITSGYRTPEYNKRVGGVIRSQHIKGKAADIKTWGATIKELDHLAKAVGFGFTKRYSTYLHVDVRQ